MSTYNKETIIIIINNNYFQLSSITTILREHRDDRVYQLLYHTLHQQVMSCLMSCLMSHRLIPTDTDIHCSVMLEQTRNHTQHIVCGEVCAHED